jgi:hypothetical protein
MKSLVLFVVGSAAFLAAGPISFGQITTAVERVEREGAEAGFRFKNIPRPSRNDAATQATFTLVDGTRDANGGSLEVLHDGKLPVEEDQPSANFFFRAGTDGGRVLVDLGRVVEVRQVNTYSWHADTRAPQVYDLYGSEGSGAGFNAQPKRGTDPAGCGWKLIAKVDSRPKTGDAGGQYGVSVSDASGAVGRYRYLLLDMFRTEAKDSFGNTFYSEIDVIDQAGPLPEAVESSLAKGSRTTVEAEGGKYQISIDTSETPDLTEWAEKELAPVVREWYPKLVRMLPSEGFEAPAKLSIVFSKDMQGVAATSGTRIRCAASWIRRNLAGEAKGAIVHEMVHVVQQYGRGRRANPNAIRAPGWLTEGITDYIRFYLYEPQTHGAEITKRNIARARYDASYRITGNFLNWVTGKYDKDFVCQLNAAIREGKYSLDFWKQRTGHTMQELGDEWKKGLEEKVGAPAAATNDSKPKVLPDVPPAAQPAPTPSK